MPKNMYKTEFFVIFGRLGVSTDDSEVIILKCLLICSFVIQHTDVEQVYFVQNVCYLDSPYINLSLK